MRQKTIPICSPKLPLAEHILPYLHTIDKNRWYSNFGPLITEFTSRIAALFSITSSEVISAANGTLLLELCLKALGIPAGSLCILPSWTFVATPLAVVNAKLEPLFVDVELATQTINPEKLERDLLRLSQLGKIGAVIVVAPYGMPVNVQAWDDFTARTKIPVLIDAAAAFDTILALPHMQAGQTPLMVSLHATKVLGIGEGAVLLCKNQALISQVQSLTQFGFPQGVRDATTLGTNAKLSEYAGAVGLAALDTWKTTRSEWEEISSYYQHSLENAGIEHLLSPEWVPCTCNVLMPYQADRIAEQLNAIGIMSRKWWGDGCHHQVAFQHCRTDDLSNTEYLRQSVFGLPFYIGMTKEEINYIVDKLVIVAKKATPVASAAGVV